MMIRRILCLALTAAFTAVQLAHAAVLFPAGSDWKYFVGTQEASAPDPTAWRQPGFNDSTWPTGNTPIGYGPAGIVTNLGRSQDAGYLTFYLRKEFHVANPFDFISLELPVRIDDGYVVWLNGVEVGRYNVPDGELAYDSTSVTFTSDPVDTLVTIPNASQLLREGPNLLAVHVLNVNWTSSDLFFNASLTGIQDTTAPVVLSLRPTGGAIVRQLDTIEVLFSKPVDGVDATDLLINGQPTRAVTMGELNQFVFEFPEPPTGIVDVAWAPNHGITDLSSAANPFAGGSWTYTLDPNADPPGLLITEFMASNTQTLNDDEGDRSDWIEIFNSGELAENLEGWFLTDDPNQLTQWRFPAVTLVANGYLVVFASGKDRTNPAAPLHTNFRLATEGEYLALVDPHGNIVSEFAPTFPPQFDDISYGRDRANPSIVGFFPTPTPGAPNLPGGPGFAPEITFSRPGGSFLQPFSLALTTASPAAQIRYTIDGTLPTETSPLYANPIPINTTTQVRARAFEPGLLPGLPSSQIHLQIASSLASFSSDLPIVLLHNFGAGAIPASPVTQRQFVGVVIVEPDATGRTYLTNTASLSARAGINIRGSSTKGLPKSSYRLEFWDEFGDGRNRPVLDMPAEEDWILYAPNEFDVPLIHNPFAFQLSRDVGRYAPRARMVEVFVNTTGGTINGPVPSGHYRGVYVLSENIKRGSDRVDIERLAPEHTQAPEVTGGYLLKIDRRDSDERDFSAAGLSIIYRYPNGLEMVTPQRSAQANYIRNYFNSFYNALNSTDPTHPVTGYPPYIDELSWIDHNLLNVIPMNVDALRLSAYFFKGRNRPIEMGPIWDFDRSMGTSKGGDTRAFNPINWRGQTWDEGTDFFNSSGVFSNPWYHRLFRQIDFWQRYIDRYQDLRTTFFSNDHVFSIVDDLANQLREAQPREVARWGGSGGSDTRPRSGTLSYNGYTHSFPGTYQGEIDFMKRWLADRLHFMDTNFLARPTFSHPSGTLTQGTAITLSGPPGATLYYTLDGTDPRLPGGALRNTALTYFSPIPIHSNTRITTRARNLSHQNLTGTSRPPLTTPWSGVHSATYIVFTPDLVVTELMYHPPPPPPGDLSLDKEQFEFLEILNRGTTPASLTGARFIRGIDFSFPNFTLQPGQRIVLAKNLNAFHSRYGLLTPALGPYEGQLDNAGERLTLVGPLDEVLLDFRYSDAWYPITDGHSFSLVLHNESTPTDELSHPAPWRPSSQPLGSPAITDPLPPTFPNVVINEALTHTDLPQVDSIELFNPTHTPADVSGWYLTDTFRDPTRFRIPNGTVIPAGGFVVFDESHFNTGAPGSFALSSLGEEVYLFSADPLGQLTGYLHGFGFGAAFNGVSFGRHVTFTGTEYFVPQTSLTLGHVNSAPHVGPVVINETMYHPDPVFGIENNTRDEFIELHNLTADPVPLFHTEFPALTWRLRSAVRFDFPPNTTLPPHGFLIVVGFDPALNLNDLHAFRTRYQLSPGVPILGPFDGRLNNSGETVRLLMPDRPQTTPGPELGLVPYVLTDEVDYTNAPPWPTEANATGNSIQRIVSHKFGNEPLNWHAAPPTPGRANTPTLRDSNGDGLPDAWKLTHDLNPLSNEGHDGPDGDPDLDGFTNREEFLAGTDPHDPLSYLHFHTVTPSGSSVLLQFTATPDRTYTVLYRDATDNGPWLKLQDVPAQSQTAEITAIDPLANGDTTRFYRLVTPQQ
jgi:hypothetical protein